MHYIILNTHKKMFTLFFQLLIVGINSQGPQLCNKITEYSSCSTKASQDISSCNGQVTSVPDASYYTCLCKGHQSLLQCYSICPDDPQMQLQLVSQKQNMFATCKAAQDMAVNSPSSSSSIGQSSTSSASQMADASSSSASVSASASSSASVSISSSGSVVASPSGKAATQSASSAGKAISITSSPKSDVGNIPPSWVSNNEEAICYLNIVFVVGLNFMLVLVL